LVGGDERGLLGKGERLGASLHHGLLFAGASQLARTWSTRELVQMDQNLSKKEALKRNLSGRGRKKNTLLKSLRPLKGSGEGDSIVGK